MIYTIRKRYLINEIHDIISYGKLNKVVYLKSKNPTLYDYSEIFSKIFTPYLEKVERISDTKNIALICIEVYTDSDLNQFIKVKKENPQIPFLLILEKHSPFNIDNLYEDGADYVLSMKHLEDNFPQSLIDLLEVIKKLLAKYYICNFYWESINTIKNNRKYFDALFTNFNNTTKELDIHFNVILKILYNTFGYVRRPHSLYEKEFDHSIFTYIYLTFWSVLNKVIEISNLSFFLAEDKPANSYDNYFIVESKSKLTYEHWNKSEMIPKDNSFLEKWKNYYLPNYLVNDRPCYYVKSYKKTLRKKDSKKIQVHPRDVIPLLIREMYSNLLGNKIDNLLQEFSLLNQLRNELFITHGRFPININKIDFYDNKMMLCSLRLFNFIHFLLIGSFIEEKQISFMEYLLKNIFVNSMRIRGTFEKASLEENKNYFIMNYIDELKNPVEVLIYTTSDEQFNRIKELKKGNKIEVFVTIKLDKAKSNDKDKYMQFLNLIDFHEII